MNTEAAAALVIDCRETQLHLLREAAVALEAGDTAAFENKLDALMHRREHHFASGIAQLARRVHQAINDMDLDSRLSCMAGRDIPDACGHLDYVVRMTEQAAHRTLDLVEESRGLLDDMGKRQHELLTCVSAAGAARPGDAEAMAGIADAMGAGMTGLRGNLSELAQAQEYQDLSGQLIRRVIGLVQDVEKTLLELLQAAGVDLKNSLGAPIKSDSSTRLGPAAKHSASQQDADSLMGDLGF